MEFVREGQDPPLQDDGSGIGLRPFSVILSKRSAPKNPLSFVSAYGIRAAGPRPRPTGKFGTAYGILKVLFQIVQHTKSKEKREKIGGILLNFLDGCDTIILRRNSIVKFRRECVFLLWQKRILRFAFPTGSRGFVWQQMELCVFRA